MAQVQFQMYTCGVKKYFCLAQPDFEKSKYVNNNFLEYVNNLLSALESFWKIIISPLFYSPYNSLYVNR